MRKNQLGKSDLYVSEIGFGCMSLGVDVERGVRLVHQALDCGVNFLDTADLYDYGKNEEIVGKALKGKRDQVILATKVGNRWKEGEHGWSWDPSKAYIKEAVTRSLQRLSTDYIDLYQLHGGTKEDPIAETIEAFEELKKEGLIRAYGISSLRPNVIREYVARSNIDSVMLPYSILDRRPEEEILPLLKRHQISAIARGPLAKGYLSDRTRKQEKGDGMLNYSEAEIEDLVAQIKQMTDADRTVAHVALRYPLGDPTVATVIPGASRESQVIENAAAGASRLSHEERRQLQQWSKANQYEKHVD